MAFTAQFFVIYITRLPTATLEEVKTQMDHALDWYRISESLWIVYTTSDPEKWFARLSPLVKEAGRVFICKLDTSVRQGWMNKDFWSWLRREKPEP